MGSVQTDGRKYADVMVSGRITGGGKGTDVGSAEQHQCPRYSVSAYNSVLSGAGTVSGVVRRPMPVHIFKSASVSHPFYSIPRRHVTVRSGARWSRYMIEQIHDGADTQRSEDLIEQSHDGAKTQ